ncbi:MAG: hypothetical protein AB1758_23685 [Candidatus Eremiobacterota bacterium]
MPERCHALYRDGRLAAVLEPRGGVVELAGQAACTHAALSGRILVADLAPSVCEVLETCPTREAALEAFTLRGFEHRPTPREALGWVLG